MTEKCLSQGEWIFFSLQYLLSSVHTKKSAVHAYPHRIMIGREHPIKHSRSAGFHLPRYTWDNLGLRGQAQGMPIKFNSQRWHGGWSWCKEQSSRRIVRATWRVADNLSNPHQS